MASTNREQSSSAFASQPKDSSQSVLFEVNKDSGALVRISVRDPGGVGVEFHFANWQFDPPVGDSLFRFVAPSGVAIVNGELSSPKTGVSP
jgi:outer membrane lipoprotein-sorting protein